MTILYLRCRLYNIFKKYACAKLKENCHCSQYKLSSAFSSQGGGGGGGRGLPFKRLMNVLLVGVAFSIELLEWGRTFSESWGKNVLYIYG